jgi:hypothetical protein
MSPSVCSLHNGLTVHQLGLIRQAGLGSSGEGDEVVEGGKGVQRGHKQLLAERENTKIERELSRAAVRIRAGQMARFRETLPSYKLRKEVLATI